MMIIMVTIRIICKLHRITAIITAIILYNSRNIQQNVYLGNRQTEQIAVRSDQSLFPREQNLTTQTFQFSYQDPSSVMGGASLMSGNSLRWICQFSWCKKFYQDNSFQIVWCSELGIHMNWMFFPNLVARLNSHKKMAREPNVVGRKSFQEARAYHQPQPDPPPRSTWVPSCIGT